MKKLALPALVAVAATTAFAPGAPAATKTVRIDDDVFRPGSISINVGDTVRWRWVGDNPHNVTVTRGRQRFRSGTKRSGTYSKRIRRGGRYTIVCTVHPGMDMTIRAR
ncbi:MAG: plastocyanin/azurin family copper-binding protein [Actinomycetota bacterium]|nr:plastocyanin/azurin family copper-binding protein [Actinomycetota bacterium]